jgi:hypothetical protein
MAEPTITIQFEGDPDENGDVRLPDFVEKVTEFLAALNATESLLPDEARGKVYYRIVELSRKSPATISVMPIGQRAEARKIFARTFAEGIRTVNEPKTRKDALQSAPSLRPFAALTPTSDKHIRRMTVKVKGVRSKKIVLLPEHPNWLHIVPQVATIEPDYSHGSVSGRIEQLNVHAGANRFRLWPRFGPVINGTFGESVRHKIVAGADKYVRVYGRLKFIGGDDYPHEIDHVSDVEEFEPDEDLPRLADLRGIAPDATGGMNIRDFVESLYDAD